MKKLFIASLFLMGTIITSLGAVSIASESGPYRFGEDYQYSSLGFGSTEVMRRFMTNQVVTAEVGIYQENGTGGFEYGVKYLLYKGVETLEELIIRACNTEFRRQADKSNFRMDQRFSFMCLLTDAGGGDQFGIVKTPFTPEQSGGIWSVPSAAFNSLNLKMVNANQADMQVINWPKIRYATLVVHDKNGKIIYVGDSRKNSQGNINLEVLKSDSLFIARKYITGGCTGILTVATYATTTASYSLTDGQIVQPLDVPIVSGITAKTSSQTISINGGARQTVSLLCYEDLRQPPKEVAVTLDEAGTAIWTNDTSTSMAIFRTAYKHSIASAP